MNTVFYLSAVVAILSTVMVITRLNAMHALLYLVVSLLSVAVMFFTLGAPFIAALEVIIYAGAIMVLFIFAIMLLNLGPHATTEERKMFQPGGWIGPALFAAVLLAEVVYVIFARPVVSSVNYVDPAQVGAALFGPYLIGVELASILLLAALVGAYHLGQQRKGRPQAAEALQMAAPQPTEKSAEERAPVPAGQGE
jgi:NADH-quinone oxidoreductase subunit J